MYSMEFHWKEVSVYLEKDTTSMGEKNKYFI